MCYLCILFRHIYYNKDKLIIPSMATKNTTPEENQNSIDALNDRLTDISVKVENNKKVITVVVVILIAVILGILGYIYLVQKPKAARTQNAIGVPDVQLALGNDSLALEGYLEVADSYDAPRADLMAAGLLYMDGRYEEAAATAAKADMPEEITEAAALALEGDSYANLGKMTEAAEAYKKAVKESDANPYYTPYFMLKLARAYRAMEDYAAEAKTYEEIKTQYPNYATFAQIDLDKYIARAKAQAAQK